MSMQPLALKKTCDTCTRSKVKCSGGFPCSRCESKGIQCFYSPRKKRGIQPKKEEEFDEDECDQPFAYGPIVTKSNFDTHPKGALGSLAAHERRSWSVFFTLYKHYGTSCSLYWFNRQLRKMQSYLERRGDTEALDRLTTWMEAISIDIKTLTDSMEKCKLKVMSKAVIHPPGIVSLYGIRGSVRDPDEHKLLQLFEEKKRSKTPFIKIKTKFLDDEQEGVEIQCNEAFTKVFGHTAENLEKELNWAGGGLLPWGGDILGRLLTREKDLLAFVQILAIKFNTFGPPKEIPTVREIPSCHIMEVEIKDGPDNGRKVTVNCLIKCVHREVLKLEGSTLDISIDLTPLAPHDHLLDPDRIVSTVELERPAEVYKIKRRAVDELILSQSQEDPNVAISKNNKKKVRETNGGGQPRIQKPVEDVVLVQPVEIKQNENGDYEQISEENATNGSYAVDASQKSLYDFGLSQSNMSQLSIFDLDDAKEPTQRSEVEVEASQRSTYSVGVTTHKILNNQTGGTKDDKKGQLKAKTASLSELEEFLQGDMPEETAEEYLNVDTQKSVLIDDALEQFAEDEDYHIEDDWFEDLLDWSSQSTVPPEYRPKRLLNPRN